MEHNINKKDTSPGNHWDKYYQDNIYSPPSLFAKYCLDKIDPCSTIIDMGCGNGRDSVFFADHHHKVYACDQSHNGLRLIQHIDNITTLECSFADINDSINESLDVAYSRFSLHAVDKKTASKAISWVSQKLRYSGKFFIEVRTIYDELYNSGTKVESDAFVTDHYRRFIRPEDLKAELTLNGFKIHEFEVSNGFAPYQGEDPKVLRVYAGK